MLGQLMCLCLFLQVHWRVRCTGHMWQHSRAGEQAEAALPKTPRSHAIHRRRSQRVDPRMPAPIPTPSLELQHAGARPYCVWPRHVAQSVFVLRFIPNNGWDQNHTVIRHDVHKLCNIVSCKKAYFISCVQMRVLPKLVEPPQNRKRKSWESIFCTRKKSIQGQYCNKM